MIKASIRPQVNAVTLSRLKRQARPALRRQAEVLGESMVRETVRIIDENFQVGDPAHRKPGPHLRNSFTYRVQESAEEVRVTLTIRRGVSAKKIAALEYGTTKSYPITPTGTVSGTGGLSQRLSTSQRAKLTSAGISTRDTQWLRWPGPTGDDVFMRSVTHKPFAGVHFMQRGRAAAIAKLRNR